MTDEENGGFDVRDAIRTADWPELIPELAICARRHLRAAGWMEGERHKPSGMEVEELISEAVQRVLEGRRKRSRDDPPQLVPFLCNVMRSICGHRAEKLARTDLDPEAIEETAAPTASSPGTGRDYEHPFLSKLGSAIEGDDDLEMYVLAVEEVGPRRDEIAAALEWPHDKVSVIRKKLRRRLEAVTPAVRKDGDK